MFDYFTACVGDVALIDTRYIRIIPFNHLISVRCNSMS